MKLVLCLFVMASFSVGSCQSETPAHAFFYDEHNNNNTREIKNFEGNLYILGQHYKENHTNTLLCLDSNLHKLWDVDLGDTLAGERFDHFEIDGTGNIYLSGLNKSMNSARLLKVDNKGKAIWSKSYPAFKAFENIIYRSHSLRIAAEKTCYVPSVMGDSAFVVEVDEAGELKWSTPVGTTLGAPRLDTAGDHIIYSTNKYRGDGGYPVSELCSIGADGTVQWTREFDAANTGIQFGVKTLNMKVDPDTIYLLCNSFNSRVTDMKLFMITSTGNRAGAIVNDVEVLKSNFNTEGEYFMFTGLNISFYKQDPAQLVVRKRADGTLYFSRSYEKNRMVAFTKMNGHSFIIADNGDFQKGYLKWEIFKE